MRNVCLPFSKSVLVSVFLQIQVAEAKITHVIQLKHTLDLVPRLRVCEIGFKSFYTHVVNDEVGKY